MEARLAAARGYNIFVQCLLFIQFYYCFIKTTTNTFFPFLSYNNSGNIFDRFYAKLCQSVLHLFIWFMYCLEITRKTHINHIFSQSCVYCLHVSSVKTFLLFIQLSYSNSRVRLSISYTSYISVRERPLASSMNETSTARECSALLILLSPYLLILDTNKMSGHVSFNLNLDLNLETSMWKHLLFWMKCGGQI